MKTIILILLISINNFRSLGLTNYIPYYQITNEAEWNYDQGKFGIAEKQLTLAFDMDLTPKWKDVLLYVKILNRKPNRNLIYKTLLNQLQAKGGTSFKISEYLKREKIKLSKTQYLDLDHYVLDSNSTTQKHLKFLNNCIDSMHYFDQEIRNKQRNNIDSVYIENENKFLSILDAQEYIDSLNAQKLLSLFQNHELANFEIVNYKLSILLTHLDSRFFQLKSHLLLMLKNGNLDPFDFAVANDRAVNKIGNCSEYFSYLPSIENLDCLNLDKIKISREKIGLSTHYFRPSFNFYINVNNMMKYPLEPYFNNFKNNG
jgi:hypothetical protein